MKVPVLKTKHRSVGPRKGVGNAFQPGTINPSKKKQHKAVPYVDTATPLTLGDIVRRLKDKS